MKSLYNLPKKIIFCTECVMSNQRPSSIPEFFHDKKRTGAKYLNIVDGVCDACRFNEIKKNIKSSLLKKIYKKDKFYFIHSYYCKPKDQKIITTNSIFNNNQFCSSIKSKNIEAFQFHPEKSSLSGLKIFKNIKKELNEAFV